MEWSLCEMNVTSDWSALAIFWSSAPIGLSVLSPRLSGALPVPSWSMV